MPYSNMWNRAHTSARRPNMLMVNPHPSAQVTPSPQGYMAKASAEQIAEQGAYLHEELEREPQIPAWMEAALTRAKHHLDGVAGYLGLHNGGRRELNAAALVRRSGCCEPCVSGGAADHAVARPSDIPPWACHGPAQPTRCPPYAVKSSAVPRQQNAVSVGGACCDSCGRGGPCQGGCGDKCTKGCAAHVRNANRAKPSRARRTNVGRLLNHAAGQRAQHSPPQSGSYYAKQNAWQIASHGAKVNEMLTGQENLPDWVEHKLYETAHIVDELAHRIAYIRHTGHPLMAQNGEPDAVP